ncbi:hypothetical protein CVV38_00420 [Candidatus Peregrinibacteria bacterium HGW-Peregrinibacteria-1]|nr:MAG: hypothetical protein CVV38_00420 [Candidatus Peregrinibacteria bacterium HGW-Peregrinibacteria-1]
MIILLSPSKTQDFNPLPKTYPHNIPYFLQETEQLIKKYRKYSIAQLRQKMKISENLAILNQQRYQDFHTPLTPKNSKQAIFAFQGDVYTDLHPEKYTPAQLQYLQDHLRIISGLYGLLRPFDLIQPYRLEMKYEAPFWTNKLHQALNQDTTPETPIINLASNEYSKPLLTPKIKGQIISPVFKEKKDDTYKLIAIYAKKARGTMAEYIITNQLQNPEQIKNFNLDGYTYNPKLSKPHTPTFTRG